MRADVRPRGGRVRGVTTSRRRGAVTRRPLRASGRFLTAPTDRIIKKVLSRSSQPNYVAYPPSVPPSSPRHATYFAVCASSVHASIAFLNALAVIPELVVRRRRGAAAPPEMSFRSRCSPTLGLNCGTMCPLPCTVTNESPRRTT